jgi:hypothetical protein
MGAGESARSAETDDEGEGVNSFTRFPALFDLHQRFFAAISMACTISAKFFFPHPSGVPA